MQVLLLHLQKSCAEGGLASTAPRSGFLQPVGENHRCAAWEGAGGDLSVIPVSSTTAAQPSALWEGAAGGHCQLSAYSV